MTKKPRGIYLEPDVIDSQAFQRLNGTALKVYLYFLRRRRMKKLGPKGRQSWEITNNGEIVFSYSEAQKKYGLTKRRFRDALDKLIELGFIDIAHHGGGLMGDCTLYAISERWRNYGTHEFIQETRPKDNRGLGITPQNWEERTGKKRRKASKQGNETVTSSSNKTVTGESIKTHREVTKTLQGKSRLTVCS